MHGLLLEAKCYYEDLVCIHPMQIYLENEETHKDNADKRLVICNAKTWGSHEKSHSLISIHAPLVAKLFITGLDTTTSVRHFPPFTIEGIYLAL